MSSGSALLLMAGSLRRSRTASVLIWKPPSRRGTVEFDGRNSRDTGIQGWRRNSHRTDGELTLRRMLTNFRAKDLQQPCRFPSEGLLATPAVLIPLAPPASPRLPRSLRKNRKILRM